MHLRLLCGMPLWFDLFIQIQNTVQALRTLISMNSQRALKNSLHSDMNFLSGMKLSNNF